MSHDIQPLSSSEPANLPQAPTPLTSLPQAPAPAASLQQAQAQAPKGSKSSGGSGGGGGGFSSLEDLRNREPKLYNVMLQGMAQQMCNQLKKSQDRIKKLNDESQRNA